jgi:hypothetical protein
LFSLWHDAENEMKATLLPAGFLSIPGPRQLKRIEGLEGKGEAK